jgi:hypothetical protein
MTNLPVAPVAIFSSATTMLDRLGFSSERIVERAGLPQYQYLEPHLKIPGIHLYQIHGLAARALGEEAFGAMIPGGMPITRVGSLGKAVTGSPTVHTTVNEISRLYSQSSSVAVSGPPAMAKEFGGCANPPCPRLWARGKWSSAASRIWSRPFARARGAIGVRPGCVSSATRYRD